MVITCSTNGSVAQQFRQFRHRRKTAKHNIFNKTISNNYSKLCMPKRRKKEEEDTRKKKMKRGSSDSGCNHDDVEKLNVISDIYNANINPDFGGEGILVCEILSRLPVKSLMQCKCVCKRWRFLIEKDANFIDLHLARSTTRPCLLITVQKPFEYPAGCLPGVSYVWTEYGRFLLTADLSVEDKGGAVSAASVHTIREMDSPIGDSRIMGPMNGLMGFHDPEFNCGVRIFNVSTREVTPWIESTVLRKLKEEEEEGNKFRYYRKYAQCKLGFNPSTKEHKMICIWSLQHANPYHPMDVVCEVLTVGDNKWRRIDEFPTRKLRSTWGNSVSVNGSIYYTTFKRTEGTDANDIPDFIVAFDLGSEKFREIRVPDFILDQPQDNDEYAGRCVDILELSGHVALLGRVNGYTVKLWLFDDAYVQKENNASATSTTTDNQNWKEITIQLPYFWGGDRSLDFVSVVGTDLICVTYPIILTTGRPIASRRLKLVGSLPQFEMIRQFTHFLLLQLSSRAFSMSSSRIQLCVQVRISI
ncbi:F-box protein At1g52495-like isoform X1 [Papaver somniferum]|uniref:F-box protein At1g52495-like isoform X1 n=1 Tax=Papaver somniferum TaxID=3469 RepID=UPI000E6F9CA2|nr:F-box protein At1g52495-like isoform X1 [Papaver somniferum]